ncbi:MAG: SWIM zinc finger family protein [bacterium]|nr:SWIM zinc finger family protein [bacterium]MCM1375513.1 SWIM zinc finger family protein [Muribaculum sp.]
MADWRQSLAEVDEDYLAGISNKGIVKRAYKDLESAGDKASAVTEAMDWSAAELEVAVGGEKVTLRLPLGESRCSCPSRSICRHVIMGIVLARRAALNAGGESGDSGIVEVVSNEESSVPAVEGADDSGMANSGSLAQQVWQEIMAYPRKPLLRALGSRGLRRLVEAMAAGAAPEPERGTVVRVELPGQATVKLLSPLEYSTCTCHKKELCSHKAEAILWCQYLDKQLTVEQLEQEAEQQPELDLHELSGAAERVRDCLEHLLETGLVRSSEEQARELERLAILCHNVGLAGWEGDLRALAKGYDNYQRRVAGQSVERLADELQALYHRTGQLMELTEAALSAAEPSVGHVAGQIQALAGEFRAQYLSVGDLELTGITMEHFVSDSGYEGDTVYFLDTAAGSWYTYTHVRPTFYEGKKRSAYQEKPQAPWGIALPLENLARMRILLRGAKCDSGGRLSSSQETRGEILGKSELTADILKGWYYREYDRLFDEQIPRPGRASQAEQRLRLVFVQAARFEQGQFDEIAQKLELPIWDAQGRQVSVELPYSKREEGSIRYLERLKQQEGLLCFLGKIYLRGSQLCLYPVDLLEREELEQMTVSTAEKDDIENNISSAADTECASAACQGLQSYLEEVRWLLQDIYQAGDATVQDATLQAMRKAREQGITYGMTAMSDWLCKLEEQLAGARHRLDHPSDQIMKLYCRLWKYVSLCLKRTAYDMARLSYCGGSSAAPSDS